MIDICRRLSATLCFAFVILTIITSIFYSKLSTELIMSINEEQNITEPLNVTENKGFRFYENAYSCGIMGGKVKMQAKSNISAFNALSLGKISISVNGPDIIYLDSKNIHSIILNSQAINIDGENYEIANEFVEIIFENYGTFGTVKMETLYTYHDKNYKYPTDKAKILSGNVHISNGKNILEPEILRSMRDTVIKFIALSNEKQLFLLTLINKYEKDYEENSNSSIYVINDSFDAITAYNESGDTCIIENNTINFMKSGNYIVTLIQKFYVTKIKITVSLPNQEAPLPDAPIVPPIDDNLPPDTNPNQIKPIEPVPNKPNNDEAVVASPKSTQKFNTTIIIIFSIFSLEILIGAIATLIITLYSKNYEKYQHVSSYNNFVYADVNVLAHKYTIKGNLETYKNACLTITFAILNIISFLLLFPFSGVFFDKLYLDTFSRISGSSNAVLNTKQLIGGIFFRFMLFFGFCALIIPGILIYINYHFYLFIVAENPNINIREAFNLSKGLIKGHKKECFIMLLKFFALDFLIIVSFGILARKIITYKSAAKSLFYMSATD